ncbi:MAG: tetratricopeptide repeat protein [Candidatus Marinimicrobia bacterium]|nr:tetratricopeptide repeat protein [Candidatus Neomarinimicrobiota bacterium]
MPQYHRLLFILALISSIGLYSCAYFNTFYNAEQYFDQAQRLTKENQLERVSKEELNLYTKTIEKSKKLIQNYPESKYCDDAQFLIAKSYYFRGDYSIAKTNFEILASEFTDSPFSKQVPLWIGRCLLKTGDLEMARHEASRMIRGNSEGSLKADAFLMMGEIAIQQDSLDLAEEYLRRVIDISPDGYTKAQAQFQIGKMREGQNDHQGALDAYRAVSHFDPSESLKVEAIIRQTSMLKALGKDEEAVEMIVGMLQSEKFVDIRGQLELELGKLFTSLGQIYKAESKFMSIVENYTREEIAAEADYYLGDLYLTHIMNYQAAREAFDDIRRQSTRSPYVTKGSQRVKQIDRYEQIQFDHVNLQRQLSGLKPLAKEKKTASTGRASQSSRLRGRGNDKDPENQMDTNSEVKSKVKKTVADTDTVQVTHEDSIHFKSKIDENRYALAEYLLFEFAKVDTTLEILQALESSSEDSTIKHQAAYMQYYALSSVKGDLEKAQQTLSNIEIKYPRYYELIMEDSKEPEAKVDLDQDRLKEITVLFEERKYEQASKKSLAVMENESLSRDIRSKACFNYGILNDHFLFDRTNAIMAYTYLVETFPTDPLAITAQKRLDLLSEPQIETNPQDEKEEQEEKDPRSEELK